MPVRRLIRRNLSPLRSAKPAAAVGPRDPGTADVFSGTWSTIIEHFAKHMYTHTHT